MPPTTRARTTRPTRTTNPTTRRPDHASLRSLETPLVGAWIACVLMYWIAASNHRLAPGASPLLDASLRAKLTFAQAGIGLLLVLLLLRRGEHGIRLLLPFAALAIGSVGALWLAPDIELLAVAQTRGEMIATAVPLRGMTLMLGGVDAAQICVLFLLLVLELRGARPLPGTRR
jgi:hypothetical protein